MPGPGNQELSSLRVRVAHATRMAKYSGDPSAVTAARRDLAAAKLEEAIARTVAEAPPLSADQLDRLANLLRAAGRGAA